MSLLISRINASLRLPLCELWTKIREASIEDTTCERILGHKLAKDKALSWNANSQLALICLIFFFPILLFAEEKPFTLIISSHDESLIPSISSQQYENYRILYVVDKEHDTVPTSPIPLTAIRNKQNNGSISRLCQGVFLCEDKEVIIDMDKPFSHDHVLSDLNQIYANPEIWMTIAADHLPPTYYAGVFHAIKKDDFLLNGKFIENASYITFLKELAGDHLWPKPIQSLESQTYRPLQSFLTPTLPVYSSMEDPFHPSNHDYQILQNYLSYGKRDHLDRLDDYYQNRVKNMVIIGDGTDELPQQSLKLIHCSPHERENCIILYSSFHPRYLPSMMWLENHIARSDFQGHLLTRIGGWPNAEGGSLYFAHIPYAFKTALFQEAKRLGFKRVLWIDTSIVPLVSLNTIFEIIEQKGYLFVGGKPYTIGKFMNAPAAAYFGLTLEQTHSIPTIAAGILGLDLTSKIGQTILTRWTRAAKDSDAFFTSRPEQNTLSIILYQLGIEDFIGWDRLPHTEVNDTIKPGDMFLIDRGGSYREAHP